MLLPLSQSWFNIYDLGLRANCFSILGNFRQFLPAVFFPQPFGLARLEGNGVQYELNASMGKDYYSTTRGEVIMTV